MSRQEPDPEPWDDPLWYARYRNDPEMRRVASQGPRTRPGEGLGIVRAIVVAAVTCLLLAAIVKSRVHHRPMSETAWLWMLAATCGAAALKTYAYFSGDPWIRRGMYAGTVTGILVTGLLLAFAVT